MKRLGSFFRRNKAVSAHGSRTEENASSGADFTEPPSWVENVPGSGDQEDDPLVVADVQKNVHTDGFGDKSISTFGGFCLLANNITGPAMVNIPVVYQQAGWLPCTIVMVVVMVVSGFSATMMCKAMSMLPGNDRFQGRVEISGLARHYFPKWGYYLTLLLLVISLQATNIASIIISSQTADFAFVAIFKWVCGVEIYPDPGWTVVNEAGDSNSPFGNVVIISIGFVVILLTAIPLGYFNLDDNIYIQVVAFFSMLAIVVGIWTVDCFIVGLDLDRVKVVSSDQSQVLGVIIFNFAFVTSVPSWVNEKKESVSVNRSIWTSTIISTGVFILLGLMCGWAFYYTGNEDVLDVINSQSKGRAMRILADVSVYAFPEVVLVSSIPVFSIIVRYNILESGLMGKHWANFWAVIVPWVIAVPFYTGSGLNNILSWVGLIVNGVINFIIPLLLYMAALRRYPSADMGVREKSFRTRTASLINSINNDADHSLSYGALATNNDPEDPAHLSTNRYIFKTFHAVPLWMQRRLHLKPFYVAGVLATIITIGILATVIMDFVYLGLGNNVFS